MTFLDLWVTGGGNNDASYSNPKYDELVNGAKVEADVNKRWDMMKQAEDILMEDMPIIHFTSTIRQLGLSQKLRELEFQCLDMYILIKHI